MLLSICMIIKNEEKYLRRCLTALQPILDNIDSELIIADTGSTDKSVDIAKEFTPNVYFFEWINDFSAARNFTLEKSSGEWFMFIDADEILQNCDDVIRFFSSGEYRNFGNATFIIRSYSDEKNMSSYSDAHALRLARHFDDVKFSNAVHEAINPLYPPIRHLNMIADHYGYFFRENGQVTEIAREKSRRNLELLLKSLENDNVEFSVYKEIADCYQLIEDNENALKYVDMGLEKLDHSCIAITTYYSFKAVALLNLKRYEEVIRVSNDYFGADNPSHTGVLASDFDMYAIRGEADYRLERFSEAAEDFINFFKVYSAYEKGELNTDDMMYNTIKIRGNNLKAIYNMFLSACISAQKFNTAEEWIKKRSISEFLNDKAFMLKYCHLRMMTLDKTGYRGLRKLYNQLDDTNKLLLSRIIRWKLFHTENMGELLEAMKDIAPKGSLLYDSLNIYRPFFSDKPVHSEQLNEFITKHGTMHNTDILCVMLRTGADISAFLCAPDFDASTCVRALFCDYSEYVSFIKDIDVTSLNCNAFRNAASFYGRALVEAHEAKQDISSFFRLYGKAAEGWSNAFGSIENAPGDIKAGVIVNDIVTARDRKDYRLCISQMRTLVKRCPDFAPFVSDYQKDLKNEISAVPRSVDAEIAEMAAAVKHNIRCMIRKNDPEAAEKALNELEKLCPDDPEIVLIRNELRSVQQVRLADSSDSVLT